MKVSIQSKMLNTKFEVKFNDSNDVVYAVRYKSVPTGEVGCYESVACIEKVDGQLPISINENVLVDMINNYRIEINKGVDFADSGIFEIQQENNEMLSNSIANHNEISSFLNFK